ncbi:trypsin-like serine protease [Streptomyces ficellus]|uniref:Trypsin-like serine protease n=1 Tax=Streptomyces ficellus TaxID=1977088 RepID=A0A6I6FAV2_9ACTN|nr:trypsin-like serine protease [Streptomyces ficellus]QGV77322.1 trypsin-like serine protease [Streptomyces ficellus]
MTMAALAVTLGMPTTTATAAGETPPEAPYAVEDGTYPNRADVLGLTGADLIAGDGNITFTSCAGPYQIKVWAVKLKTNESRICFAADKTGYLKVNIPRAYRIETVGRDVRAGVSIANTTEDLTIARNTSKGFGEADLSDPKQAVLLEMRVTGATPTTPGASGDITGLSFTGRLDIGDVKHCTATLVDPQWVLSAKSCFADKPAESNTVAAGAPKEKTTVVLGRRHLGLMGGHTSEIVELVPHPDRDLVMGRLAAPSTIPPAVASAAGPAAGQKLTVAAFGRTETEWVPAERHDGAFTTGTVASTGFDLAPQDPAAASVCQGDAGAPAVRQVAVREFELVGIVSRAFNGNCQGGTETRTGASAVRVDDLSTWMLQTRSGKTSTLLQSGANLYQGLRLADGSWTGFTDVQSAAGDIGGIRTATAAGIGSSTHVVAVGTDGRLHHTIRRIDGTWTQFGDIGEVAGVLGSLTQVSAVSVGNDLHVLALANGKVFHTLRNASGHWSPFGDISTVTGPIGAVTSLATASVGGQLQVSAVSNGKAFHTIRTASGHWNGWGDISQVAGATGAISSIAMAGIGAEAHIVVATDGGTRQYHALRTATGHWEPFAELKSILGTVIVKSVGAAGVDGQLQLTATTSTGKLLHTVRRADRTWNPTTQITPQGVAGTLAATAVTGTL